jgi:DNA-binding MarR family transcriptional regulator
MGEQTQNPPIETMKIVDDLDAINGRLRAVNAYLKKVYGETYQITHCELRYLACAYRYGVDGLSRMAGHLDISKTAVTLGMDKLEKKKLARRQHGHPSDRRVVIAEITEIGKAVLRIASQQA